MGQHKPSIFLLVFTIVLMLVTHAIAGAAEPQPTITVESTQAGVYASFATLKVNGITYHVTEGDIIEGRTIRHIGTNPVPSIRFDDGTVIIKRSFPVARIANK